jgi:hypothetical protein
MAAPTEDLGMSPSGSFQEQMPLQPQEPLQDVASVAVEPLDEPPKRLSSWSWKRTENQVLYITIVVVALILAVYLGSWLRKEPPVPPMTLSEGAVSAQTLMQQGQTGDVIGISFANKFNPRIQIIRLVTGSRWIHVGILYRSPVPPHPLFVYEAYSYIGMRAKKGRPQRARNVRGVQLIPIEEWLQIHLRRNRLVGWNRLVLTGSSSSAEAIPSEGAASTALTTLGGGSLAPSKLQQLINETVIGDKMEILRKTESSGALIATQAGIVSAETIRELEERARDHLQEPKTSVNMNILQWVTGRVKNRKARDKWKQAARKEGASAGASADDVQNGDVTAAAAAVDTQASDKKTIFCTELATAALFAHGVLRPGVFHHEETETRHVAYTPYEVLAGLPLAHPKQMRWQGIVCVAAPDT